VAALAPGALVRRLLAERLLDAADVVDGEITITDASRSHAVSLVRRGTGGGLVVKQADPERTGPGRLLDREVTVHALARTVGSLARAAPAVRLADRDLVVADLVEPGETLWTRCARDRALEPALAGALGEALGALHAETRAASPGLPGAPPWILSALEPGDWTSADPRTAPVPGYLPDPAATAAALAALAAGWGPECLIHGDVRWENCLVDGDGVVLVDWELADRGDPLWDVAGALAELMAGPLLGLTRAAAVPPAARRLWSAWRTAYRPARTPAARRRAVALAGARLLQFAYEHAHRNGAAVPTVAPLAREAARVLADPAAAGCTLFNDNPP
jgi:aminoglycoside phosphotransferase (APT) family kinase protein